MNYIVNVHIAQFWSHPTSLIDWQVLRISVMNRVYGAYYISPNFTNIQVRWLCTYTHEHVKLELINLQRYTSVHEACFFPGFPMFQCFNVPWAIYRLIKWAFSPPIWLTVFCVSSSPICNISHTVFNRTCLQTPRIYFPTATTSWLQSINSPPRFSSSSWAPTGKVMK